MPDKFTALTPELYRYIVDHGAREDAVLRRVREETEALGEIAVMQISPDQGALMSFLARAIGARRALELGTFTGYSAICVARALPPGGTLVCCELNGEWAAIARRNFDAAEVGERIDLRLGPAAETLRDLPTAEPFDIAFIDADKPGYPGYYERVLELLRPGGVVVVDNLLQGGHVLDPDPDDEGTQAIAALNERLTGDERIDLAMVGVADGLALARKR